MHPGAVIDARGGPITFGEHCIIEDKVRITNKMRGKDPQGNPIIKEMKIGNYNLFEADCTITSSDIGDSNDFSFKCFVDDNCRIGNFCQVGPKVVLQGGSRLTDYTVMYDDNRSLSSEDSS